ncbi:hypothetical protein [Scytonema millei]|uniref:Uncharacterized protein n=1 Tax=Scytonema millei VB511283 TaxID=1245923 RepID=A0A9X5I3H0_9CYAN|nr:hypothetical protein [Scytonema millei]NHC33452.1 hypothetical protein [Scytonema millei VB511283]
MALDVLSLLYFAIGRVPATGYLRYLTAWSKRTSLASVILSVRSKSIEILLHDSLC